MNPVLKERKMSMVNRGGNKDMLLDLDATLTELKIYLESNPEDDIAEAQYQQFMEKREAFMLALRDIYDDLPDSKMLA